MTDRPMKMSEEQCTAIENMVVRVAEWLPSIKSGEKEYKKALEAMNKARQELRRLLVEDEQTDPDLTTFGELEAGDWCELLEWFGEQETTRFVTDEGCFDLDGVRRDVSDNQKVRRLLVEDEQAKPIYAGMCLGGPLDGSSMESDSMVVARPGGEYHWSWSWQGWRWHWFEDQPDPDLTTFGELGGRGWFELIGDVWPEGDRIRLLTEDRVVYDIDGMKRGVQPEEPVRRLPKPEFKS